MPLSDYYPEMKDWTAVPAEVTVSKTPAIPDDTIQAGRFLRTVLPLPLQYAPDTLKQYNRPGLSSFRTSPLGLSAVNAASQSVAVRTIQQKTNSVLLETAGIPNAIQTVLNLIPGSNITAVSDVNGGVTISGSGGGVTDGLIHGDAIWETDSAYVDWRDDFAFGSPSATTAIGELGWSAVLASGAAQTIESGFPPHLGELVMGNNGSADGITAIFPQAASVSGTGTINAAVFPLLDYPNWKMTWVWRFTRAQDGSLTTPANFNKKTFYIGLAFREGSVNSRPSIFIGCRFDKDTTAPAISDATLKLEAVVNTVSGGRNNTQGTVVDTGITPTENTWYRLDMLCTAAGVVQMAVNGAAFSSFTIPVYSDSSGGTTSQRTNGQAQIQYGGLKNPWGNGSKVTVSGITSTNAVLNGVQTVLAGGGDTIVAWADTGGTLSLQVDTIATSGLPGVFPWMSFGNDTEASPVVDTSVRIDYFSFVWNPGVGGGTGTPDATKSRYF